MAFCLLGCSYFLKHIFKKKTKMLYNYMFSNQQEEVYLLSTILLKYKAGTCTAL